MMNKKGDWSDIVVIVISILVVISAGLIFYISIGPDSLWYISRNFCKEKGYDNGIASEIHSPYYKQITCYAFFEDKETKEVFNVTKKCKIGKFLFCEVKEKP